MSAFVRFTHTWLDYDRFGNSVNPLVKDLKVESENVILNILGLSTKFNEPMKFETTFSFADIFVGKGHLRDLDIIMELNKEEIAFSFKQYDELVPYIDTFAERLNNFTNYHVDYKKYYSVISALNDFSRRGNEDAWYEPILTFSNWYLKIDFTEFVGGKTSNHINLSFKTQGEALQFRDQLMLEVEDFYKNYASYIKNIIIDKP